MLTSWKHLRTGALALALVALPAAARADDDTCREAFESADRWLRGPMQERAHLLEAREQLRVCATPGCRPWMVDECTKELLAVEARLPTVVFVVKGSDGHAIADARVLDEAGQALADELDGRAIAIDPGRRTFRFVFPTGEVREVTTLIAEGAKAQQVTVDDPASTPPARDEAQPSAPVANRPSNEVPSAASSTRALRTTSFVLGGVGAAAIASGIAFGVHALLEKNAANCDASNTCDGPALADARMSATWSTVTIAAGGSLLAGGIAMFVLASAQDRATVVATSNGVRVTMKW